MSRPGISFILALYPFTRGFSFVLFQENGTPFDWGIKEIRGTERNARVMNEIKKLVERYSPDVMVIEQTSAKQARRHERIRILYRMIAHLAQTQGIELARYTRAEVREEFAPSGARTKREIAQAIAERIPAFAPRMPRVRKIWMSADPRQSLFDAAALGLTHLAREQGAHAADIEGK